MQKDNLVLSTELMMSIGHRNDIRKVALALRRSDSRSCGLCAFYLQKDGGTLLVGAW